MIRQRKAQGTIEYLVLTTIILGVFLATGNYFKRGVQGRWKAAIDDIGEQYDPKASNISIRQMLDANSMTTVTTVPASLAGQNGVWTMRSDIGNSTETTTGGSVIGAY